MDLTAIESYAAAHHGLIARDDAVALGQGKRSWYWAIESGRLHAVHPCVARLPGAPETPEMRILAAVWACGRDALASHRSAAHVWCPADPPHLVDVIVPRRTRGVDLDGIVVHRPTDVDDLRPSVWAKIPVTNPLRTLVDLGATEPAAVRPCLERMVVAGFVSPGAVRAVLDRHARPGRAGTRILRQVLDDWTMNDRPPDSLLEERMNALVQRFALPAVEFHPRVLGYEPDFLVVHSSILVECDGWETHGLLRETFEADRVRDAELTAAGYVVVRFTWRQICRQPASVARRLRAVIARHAPDLLHGVQRLGTAGS